MAKFTPGPWIIDDSSDQIEINTDSHNWSAIATLHANSEGRREVSREEAEANAKLIQDAPELLELLTLALPSVEESEEFNHPSKRNLSRRIREMIARH